MTWAPDLDWQANLDRLLAERGQADWPGGEPPRAMRSGLLQAVVSRDLLPPEEQPRWHISLAHKDRIPVWEELAACAHELRPGVPFALGVPPRSWWINVHPHVLHLWELRDWPLIEQWKAERRGDRPT